MNFLKTIEHKLQLLLFFLAVLVYANTWTHDYAWDDSIVITSNERVQDGIKGIPDLFFQYRSNDQSDRYGYRPLTLITYALEVQVFGLNPQPAHFINSLLYGLLLVLLFRFLNSLFKNKDPWFLLLVCGLYAVHPLHTEVVANIKSRDEILAFIFGTLALLSLIKGIEAERGMKKHWLNYCLYIILAFLSKESALVFIPLSFLILLFHSELSFKKTPKHILPVGIAFLALTGIWLLVHSAVLLIDQSAELIAKGQYREDGFLGNPLKDLKALSSIFPNSVYLIYKYLQLFFFPAPLVHDYGYSYLPLITGKNPVFIGGIIGGFVFLFLLIKNLRKRPAWLFGSLFFLIGIFGYLHLVSMGTDIMAERFMFVPSLGLCIMTVDLLDLVSNVFKNRDLSVKVFRYSLLCIMVIFFAQSFSRNSAWKNNGTLFAADIEELSSCSRANYNYAVYLHHQMYEDSPARRKEYQQKILRHYKRSIEISDRAYTAWLDLGSAYMEFGEPKKALVVFKETCRLFSNLSEPFFLLGKYYVSNEEYVSAIEAFKKAKHNGWANTQTYYYLAVCYLKQREQQKAIDILVEGLEYKPDYSEYYDLLGDLYYANGEREAASVQLRKAINLSPSKTILQDKFRQRFTE
jgi:hypothetical protein